MPQKLLQVLANTLAIIEILSISLIGYSNTLICVAILLFPLNFGSLAVKTMAFFKISSLFIINPPLTMLRTNIVFYVWSNTYISNIHTIFWLIGIKSNGNYQNFIIFTCFICSIMCYVYSNTKTYTFSLLVWLVGCKCRGNYRNFNNFPSIFCHLVKIVKPSV